MGHYLEGFFRKGSSAFIFLCSFCVFVFALVQEWWALIGPIGGVLLGGIVGLIWVIFPPQEKRPSAKSIINTKVSFIIVNICISVVYISQYMAYREQPIVVYVALSMVSVILSHQILNGESFLIVLTQIILVSTTTYFSSQVIYPAGAYNVDTIRLIPAIQQIINTGTYEELFYSITPAHQILIATLSEIARLPVEDVYIFTSVFALGLTILLLSILKISILSLNSKEVLFAVLLYATASFTLRRGFFPFKGNFFRPIILIVSIYTLRLEGSKQDIRTFVVIGVSFLALVSGHQYSSGIAVIIMGCFTVYLLLRKFGIEYPAENGILKSHIVNISLFLVIVVAYSMYIIEGGGLLKRVAGVVGSLLQMEGAGGSTGGRYNEIDLFVTFISTISQSLLYGIGTLGVIVAIKRYDSHLDRLIVWIGGAFFLLALAAFVNAFVIPTPRIHGLLAMFGLNITGGIALLSISDKYNLLGDYAVYSLVAIFVIFSIASPVAGASISIVDDQVPQYNKFNTYQEKEIGVWGAEYIKTDYYSMEVPSSEVPIDIVENGPPPVGIINTSGLPAGSIYQYNKIAADRGIRVTNNQVIGGRTYAFVGKMKVSETHYKLYSNGEQYLYRLPSGASSLN